ncbi:MAG: DUF4294 domain-containing protein [Bacteroidales bacterium]|nr:DUF4294 domain-containing protein [Bacteroidales bacterium]
MKYFLLSVFICLSGIGLFSQNLNLDKTDTMRHWVVIDGDTLRHINLKEVIIIPRKSFSNPFKERQYWRMVYNIKKVLPYSKIVAATVDQIEFELSQLKTDKERKKRIKHVEDSLYQRYEKELKDLTVTQGKLLFKLVDRETSNTAYHWIDAYEGSVTAFFWQGMARLFGSNLKSKYDPVGEDKMIEQIIIYIEKGYL